MDPRYTQAYETCRKLQALHGKSYYFATRFFPEDIRMATYALYGFLRVPDEMVDNPSLVGVTDVKEALTIWKNSWKQAYETRESDHDVLLAAADTFHRFSIPYEYSEAFLDAMIQDTWKERYATYAELERYMYGSAAVVGLMMSHVIGFEPGALPHAEKLGYAMQLTNFLRDIREDLETRGRIYLPQDELARYEVTESELRAGKVTPKFVSFMKLQIAQADRLYDEANTGIRLLHVRGRFPVRAASDLYREILRRIEAQGYDVFTKRAAVSTFEKTLIALGSRSKV